MGVHDVSLGNKWAVYRRGSRRDSWGLAALQVSDIVNFYTLPSTHTLTKLKCFLLHFKTQFSVGWTGPSAHRTQASVWFALHQKTYCDKKVLWQKKYCDKKINLTFSSGTFPARLLVLWTFYIPDLSRPDLSSQHLLGPDLSSVDLSRLELPRWNLSRPDLSRTEISSPDLSRPDLSRRDFLSVYLLHSSKRTQRTCF